MAHKIAFFELEGWEDPIIRAAFPGEELYMSKDKITNLCLPEVKDFDILSVFVDSRIDGQVSECFPNLKCIATRSTGYDHVDPAALRARGITVQNVPGYGDNTVAEYTFGLILNLTRKMYKGIDQIKETGSFSLVGLRGNDIKGKTIGIIGIGRIGREVANVAKGFGMKGVMYDPFPNEQFAKDSGFVYMSLDEVLANADVITLHCPLTPQTRHLINKGNIEKIKRGAYLVNTARGPIVETEALVDALQRGIIAGAGLDVLEEEGETKDELNTLAFGHPKEDALKVMLRNHELMHMPNVLVTPHNAFNSQEAMERILHTTIENIKSFIAGAPTSVVQ
jgi:D-lactate dehydrogenase